MRRSTFGLADVLDRPLHWDELAACRGIDDPELFFPIGHADSEAVKRQALEAGLYCQTCIVRPDCADARKGASGVWGGVLHDERGRPVMDLIRGGTK